MKIKFWGTRGSIPAPGRHTVTYGGNTPCIEVRFDCGVDLIIDAGSGIRELGNRLLTEGRKADSYLLFSHYHWDHIQGLPFFTPGYLRGNKIRCMGLPGPGEEVKRILKKQMEQPYFPASMDLTFPMIEFSDLPEKKFDLCGGSVSFIRTNHPDPCLAYRFEENGRSFIYFTDNELIPPGEGQTPREEMVSFIREADILVHDAQYTRAEIKSKLGWGHSTNLDAVEFAAEGRVGSLYLFHHDPSRKDADVTLMMENARSHAASIGSALKVNACIEGEEITI